MAKKLSLVLCYDLPNDGIEQAGYLYIISKMYFDKKTNFTIAETKKM